MVFTHLVEAAPAVGSEFGPTYKVAYAKDEPAPEYQTLFEMFEASAKKYSSRPCMGARKVTGDKAGPFEYLTYKECHETVVAVASAYKLSGITAKDKIGVIGSNSPQWRMAMQAMDRQNVICVPLYETLGDNAVEYIVNHAEAKMVMACGNKLPVLLKALPKLKATLTSGIVYWGEGPADAVEGIKALGVPISTWDEFIAKGKAAEAPAVPPAADDLCTIMYTSGTTGDPKGVMITHKAIISSVAGAQQFLKYQNKGMLTEEDVFLSFLPLAHIFDRVVEEMMMAHGASIGYWQGDIKKLMEDIGACKPTLFAGVPRVFERIYNGVLDQVRAGGFIKSLIFNWAFQRKLGFMKRGWTHDKASVISDMLVFKKIKAKLGGRVRLIVTGGAPMSQAVEEFLKVAMCAPVSQGYGLTETCAASFMNFPFEMGQVSTVGPPLPGTEFRLAAVPDMNYSPSSDPPRGEVCIKGPGLFNGYYKNDEQTKEVLHDGYFRTGDIGEICPDGALKIVDRKKNIFKLSQGEYIAVEKVENAYKSCHLVEQVWVYGNSFESVLVGVVVPKEADIMNWAETAGMSGKDFKAICYTQEARDHVLKELTATAKAENLKGLEQIKSVYLEPDMFTVENDMMTPTFKLKRAPLQKKYQTEIDDMYTKLKAAAS